MACVAVTCRWLAGLVFLVAGLAKARRPAVLRNAVRGYGLPRPLVGPTSRMLPAFELVLGLALLAGVAPPVASGVAAATLLCFATVMSGNLLRGRRFDCGCGLAHGTQISWGIVARNAGLMAVAAVPVLGPDQGLSLISCPSILSTHHVPAVSQLIAMPMIAVLVAALSRLALSHGWSVVPQARRQRPSDQVAAAGGDGPLLPIVVVDRESEAAGALDRGVVIQS